MSDSRLLRRIVDPVRRLYAEALPESKPGGTSSCLEPDELISLAAGEVNLVPTWAGGRRGSGDGCG